MMRFFTVAFCGLLPALAAWAQPDEPDPIKAKLDVAKTAFRAEQTKFREGVGSHFDAREAAARTDGNKKLLDDLKVERKQFDETGLLPRSVPAAIRQTMLAAIVKTEAAYELATKEYAKAKNDDRATWIEKQLAAFKRQIEHFESRLDLFQIDTVWSGTFVWTNGNETGKSKFVVQVVERDGKSFMLALTTDGIDEEGVGTSEKGKIEWKKKVLNEKTNTDTTVDFRAVIKDDKLYWESLNNNGVTSKGVLVLEKKK